MKRILYSLALLALLLLPAAPAYAQNGPHDGRVIIGQDFSLKSGESLDGDLVVIGGEVDIEQTAAVHGDIVVIGGSLKLDGKSSGNAVVIGGVVAMGPESSVAGDLVTVGGTLQRAEGALVGGNVVTNFPAPTVNVPIVVTPQAEIPPIPPSPGFHVDFSPVGRVAGIFFQSLGLAALAMLLTLFLHPQLDRVALALTRQPLIAGSVGLLTVLLAPIAVVILVVTVLLIPVALAGIILLVLAWLFGVVALGMEIGDRFTKAIHRTWEPVLSAGVGTFLLAIVIGTVDLIPCVGWLAPILVGLVGLGAAVITIFGTRTMPPLAATAAAGTPTTPEPIPPAS